jgi:hypothetical protein
MAAVAGAVTAVSCAAAPGFPASPIHRFEPVK